MDKKTGHVISGALTTIILVFAACALTDGRSFLDMKGNDKVLKIEGEFSEEIRITNILGLGYPYGMGVFKDQFGNDWTDGKNKADYNTNPATQLAVKPAHFVRLLECDDHQDRGMLFGACTFIACVAASITVIANFGGTHTGQRKYGKIAVAGQVLLLIFTLLAFAVAGSFYNEEFDCMWHKTNVIKMTIKDYFDLKYALPFHVISFVCSLVCLILLICSGVLNGESNADDDDDAQDEDGAPDQ